MKLCTSKNVPFLNKNIPKRIVTKSYTYSEPISKEAEADLVSSFSKITLCDTKKSITETALLTTPMIKRPANRKLLMFEDYSSSDEDEPIEKYHLFTLSFDEKGVDREVDHEEIIIDALSGDDEELEVNSASSVEEDAAEDNKIISDDNSSDCIPADLESVTSDNYISDAIPISDSEDDESDDDTFDTEVERIFLYSAPPIRIGSVNNFRRQSMQCERSI